ncbi:hypothetical protein [Rhodospirillum sp. A1_3_36]|uniref:hypothetical protein n=1 Tax=Rhodospirillum sp. A1_3_36 TaxID=3391666 RepID=UPI0039A48901
MFMSYLMLLNDFALPSVLNDPALPVILKKLVYSYLAFCVLGEWLARIARRRIHPHGTHGTPATPMPRPRSPGHEAGYHPARDLAYILLGLISWL